MYSLYCPTPVCMWPLCTSYIRAYFVMVLLMCQQFNLQDYQQLVYLYFVINKIIFLNLAFAQVFVHILLSHTTVSDAIHVSIISLLS